MNSGEKARHELRRERGEFGALVALYFKGIKAFDKDVRGVFRDELLELTITRTRIALILTLLLQISNAIVDSFVRSRGDFQIYYTIGTWILIPGCVLLIIFFLLSKINDVPYGQKKAAAIFSWAMIMFGSLFFTYGELLEKSAISNATLFCLGVGIMPILSGPEIIPILSIYLISSLAMGWHLHVHPFIIQELIALACLSFFASATQYLSNLRIYKERHLLGILNNRLEELAEKDPLTELLNRRGLQRMTQPLFDGFSNNKHFAVLMLDIDHFKDYNDMYFHDAGDQCLRKIGECLRNCACRQGDIVARYGGEEFVICAQNISDQNVISFALRILDEIKKLDILFERDGKKDRVTMSIGAALGGHHKKTSLGDLINAADMELYNAKTNGRNCVSFCGQIYRHANSARETEAAPCRWEDFTLEDARNSHGRKVILVADDNVVNREILCRILSSDYAVLAVENGRQALDILEEQIPMISGVMLDLVMPVMDGYKLLETIVGNEKYKNLPIIVTTSNVDKGSEKKALMLGAWDFVSKPYDAEIIKFRLKNAIDRSQLSAFKQLKYLAEYDALTGIYNKTKFFDATRKMLDANRFRRFAFLRFDVNRFSLVNSFFGVAEGDRLLKYIAQGIQAYANDRLPFTYGRAEGDVFGMCMTYSAEEQIRHMMQFCKKHLSAYPLDYDISPNCGIYLVDNHDMPVEKMYDRATLAAKRCKGDYVTAYAFYNDEMGQSVEKEQEIINEMNTAMEKDQFTIYLQPKFNLANNTYEGAEALVRWIHPQKGLITPGDFIPVFEKNGFISVLDNCVWEKACMLLKKWMDSGIAFHPISVNVSRVNLYNPGFVDSLCKLTEKYNIPKACLNLELTESAYVENPQNMIRTINRLHDNGFLIMMDDFGSGYSSLNILKDIDVDVLKIDMRFLSRTELPHKSEQIIASVVQMAKGLGIATIAEGVETKEQAGLLWRTGCDYAQGYFFAKPMPVGDYEKHILGRKI